MQYITIVPPLMAPDLFRWRSDGLQRLVGGESHLPLRHGRDALRVGLDMLGIGCGDEVLVPAVICEVVLDALSERDIRLQYYGLSNSLEFVLGDIEARIGPSTKAIYLNHAFGWPMAGASLRALCDRQGLFLIEDCAQALGGNSEGRSLGALGDFAIYSYRKFFPLPDGAGLRVNRRYVKPQGIVARARPMRQLTESGKLIAIGIAASIGVPGALWRYRRTATATAGVPPEVHEPPTCRVLPRRMSLVSEWLLSRVRPAEMIACRRDNFAYCLEKVRSISAAEPLYKNLVPGHVPYSFPLRLEDRAHIVRRAALEAIVLEPTLARVNRRQKGLVNPDESFDALDRVAEQVISLPVHQGMTREKLDRVFDAVRNGLYEQSVT